MPPIPVVVEGLTDATFFAELLRRLYFQNAEVILDDRRGRRKMPIGVRGARPDGTQLEVELRYEINGGITRIPEIVRRILASQLSEFAVAQDIDDGSPEQVIQSIRDLVFDHLGPPRPTGLSASRKIEVEGRTVSVIPMGLDQDATLASLDITRHAMEDYLIKLLLEDAGLRHRVPELQRVLSEILPTIRRYNGNFNSSKELFQLIKPIVQHGFNDTGVVHSLFDHADPDILWRVLAPVLADVELALVPQ